MRGKWLLALSIALVAILSMSAVAGAEQGGGTGTLTAAGDGLAVMRGNGSVILSGAGVLTIRDLAGDASIDVTGRGVKREPNERTVIYGGFDGEARISGSNIVVILRGKNIKLKATGTGKFILRGHGKYHTAGEDGEWTERGTMITLP